MQVVRMGPLPDRAIEAAAVLHAKVVPEILGSLIPPRNGEGDHAKHGGGAPSADPDLQRRERSRVPLHHPAGGPPPLSGEDLVLIFPPAPFDHRGWRLAAIQDLARAAAPVRVNGIVSGDEQAIAATLAWLAKAPGITGQLLSVQTG